MALIFDSFASIKEAAHFASDVKDKYAREATVYSNVGQAADDGCFPFVLEGKAAVLVDRETDDDEEAIIALVANYGGEFAGT